MVKQKRLFMLSLLLLMLTGCGMSEELTDWTAKKANDAWKCHFIWRQYI